MKKRMGLRIAEFPAVFILTLLVVFLCVSCENISSDENDPIPHEGQIRVYCTNSSGDELHWENYDLNAQSLDDKVKKVFEFLGGTQKVTHKRALPDDVSIISYYFGVDGQLIIDFSSQYLNMGIIQETLCRAAIVKTFCQLDGVSYIEFYVEGLPLKISDIPVGLMSSTDFVNINGNESDIEQNMTVTLYMTDEKGKLLQETVEYIKIDGLKTLEQVVLEALIKGPGQNSSLVPVVNEKTLVNRVRTSDGICYVDFSEDFLSKPGKISDEIAVYSVVNTLCEIQGVTKVRLTINGNDRKNYGKVAINDFLSLRPELIEQEKAGESTGGN